MLGSFTDLVVDKGRGLRSESSGKAHGAVLIHPPDLDARCGKGALGLGVQVLVSAERGHGDDAAPCRLLPTQPHGREYRLGVPVTPVMPTSARMFRRRGCPGSRGN